MNNDFEAPMTIGEFLDCVMTTNLTKEQFLAAVRATDSVDATNLTKEQFLAAVSAAYDQFILPIDLPGPDAILDQLLKQVVLLLSARAYDRFFGETMI